MAGQLRYELIGDASQFSSATQEAAGSADRLGNTIEGLATSVRELTSEQAQLRDEQGRYVSTAREAANAAEVQEAALSELNAEGVETTEQIQEQIQRLQALERVYADDAKASTDLRDEQQRLTTQLAEVGAAAAQQNQDLSRLDQEFDQATVTMTDFASRQDMLQQELRATAAAQDRVASSGVTMRSSTAAAANNLGFEFAQAAQDARYGMAGVANQLPLMFEQFSQLTARAGSATAAFQALGRSLLGPAGLILAVTQLAQSGPQIIGWLTGASEQMSILGAETDEAEDRLRTFVETSADLQQLPQRLSKVANSIRDQLVPSGFLGTLRSRGFTSEIQDILSRPGQTPGGGTPFTVETSLERVQQMLSGTSVEARTLRRALQEAGVPIETILQGSVEQATEAIRENQEALRNWQDNLRSFAESPEAFVQEALTQFQELQERQRGLFETGVISEEDFLENQRSFLEDQIRLVQQQSPFDIRQEEFQPLLSFYRSLGGELENINNQSDDAGENLTRMEEALRDARARIGELRQFYEDLQGPQGESLVIAEQRVRQLERQVELQRQYLELNRRQAGVDISTGVGPGAAMQARQGRSQRSMRLRQARQMAPMPSLPDPGQINPASLSAQQMAQSIGDVAKASGPAAVNITRLTDAIQASSDRMQAFGLIDEAGVIRQQIQLLETSLQSLKEAGIDPSAESVKVLKNRLEELREEEEEESTGGEGGDPGDERNQQLARSIQLAAQLGTTMAQAAQQGQVQWNQLLGSVLTTIGGIVGQGNPVWGAGIAGAGQLIGSFQSGGRVDTPLQWVGEEGPELRALPQGTQVYDHKTSMRMAEASASRRQSVNVNVESDLTRLPGGDLGLIVRENQSRREKFGYDQ